MQKNIYRSPIELFASNSGGKNSLKELSSTWDSGPATEELCP